MSFLNGNQEENIKNKLLSDEIELGKIYKVKKDKFYRRSVSYSLVDDLVSQGWEVEKELKTKVKLMKKKLHSVEFEDDVWCQFHELGYRNLNYDENFVLPFGKDPKEKKQIDVIALNDETLFLIECKSSEKPKNAPSYKTEFESLRLRINGFKKALYQLYGRDIKIKYMFATRNIRLSLDSDDYKRLEDAGVYYYNDTSYKYINMLIKNYKGASLYQFLGLIFKNEKINNNKIEIPAIEGRMGKGKKKYYMFSIEPSLLLKMGFILHRTKANEEESPTYQRLLVPNRLKGITDFINDGGYFPNSLILNFSKNKKIKFNSSVRANSTSSRTGILELPNEYAIAYIIDGQHRLYGYANSDFKDSNTIPVVAMNDLSSVDQLEIFVNINENQKAVSPSLRLVLEEDLYWDDPLAIKRLKALRSSIIKSLSESEISPLSNKITIGEDISSLSFQPFSEALNKSGLLPSARGNKYISHIETSLYDINNMDHDKEMKRSKQRIISLLNLCYGYVQDNYLNIFENEKFIISNRGTYPFIMVIGSINTYLIEKKVLNKESNSEVRFEAMKQYLEVLLDGIENLSKADKEKQLLLRGAGVQNTWLRMFESIIHNTYKEFEPIELIRWKERQDKKLQTEAIKYKEEIEKHMKKTVLSNIKNIYGKNWELEISAIKSKCVERAEAEKVKNYKEGIEIKDIEWTEMFNIVDYQKIITSYWTKTPDKNVSGFKMFSDVFSIDMGDGFNSKADKTKWISVFNTHRNTLAHIGTKETGLSKDEVGYLEKIHNHFFN